MTSAAANEARPLEAGACIGGKLELVRAVGEGGMGAVWIARNMTTGGKVAIKVLRPHRRGDEHAVERFRYEATLGATLSHRNITRVFDLLEDKDGSLVLVMELLQGETLHDYYKRKGSLSTREAVAIIVPLLSALQHAHDHGVIHRDLKPTNVFLHTDPDGQVTPKLLDFGIAKSEDSSIETRTGDALGTPRYMSPEQVRSIALDARSDLFSLAVVLYEIITGQNPYPGPTPTAVLAQVLELEIDPDPAIDPRVWLELRRALSKQAYQRHASAKELTDALCKALGETEASLIRSLRSEPPKEPSSAEVIIARDVAPPEREPPSPRGRFSKRARTILIGTSTGLALAGLLFFLRPARSSDETKTATRSQEDAATITAQGEPPSSTSNSTTSESSSRADAPPALSAVSSQRRVRRHVSPPASSPARTAGPSTLPAASLGRTPGF
jgi:serine/threonine-protein kinase